MPGREYIVIVDNYAGATRRRDPAFCGAVRRAWQPA
jgi:hypothetical protein